MDFPATERTQQFYGHGDPAREAVAGKYSSSFYYEESHSSTPGAKVGEGDFAVVPLHSMTARSPDVVHFSPHHSIVHALHMGKPASVFMFSAVVTNA